MQYFIIKSMRIISYAVYNALYEDFKYFCLFGFSTNLVKSLYF